MDWICNRGSVDDIICSLRHINPTTPSGVRADVEYLRGSLAAETRGKNRVSVIKAISAKINQLKKK